MDPTEVKDKLKGVINNLIRDNPDDATKDLHDVLVAKMRSRINPDEPIEVVDDLGIDDEPEVTDEVTEA